MTTTDLALVGSADEIAELPFDQQAAMVTAALIESKAWLAVAQKGTDPASIRDFKAWAATIAEMTKQKGLASEIQADALEMLRRAERGIGLAVRNGQAAGEIRKRGDDARTDLDGHNHLVSPTEYASKDELYGNGAGYTHLAEANNEQFDEAITDARADGNVSRANVVRKIREKATGMTQAQRLDLITSLASRGYHSAQIGEQVGWTEKYLRQFARDNGIAIHADRVLRGTHRGFDHTSIVDKTVTSLAGVVAALELLNIQEVDPSRAEDWATSLSESMKKLRSFHAQIKEMTQ